MTIIQTHEMKIQVVTPPDTDNDPLELDARVDFRHYPKVRGAIVNGEQVEPDNEEYVDVIAVRVRLPYDRGQWVSFMHFLTAQTVREIEAEILRDLRE